MNLNQIKTHSHPPSSLKSVNVYLIILEKISLINGNSWQYASGTLSGTSTVSGNISPTMVMTNQSEGKRLLISLDATNLGAGPNTVEITGTSESGSASETFSFTESGSFLTDERWLEIDNIEISITADNSLYPPGSLQIQEANPFTLPENGGIYAEVYRYDNGVFTFRVANTNTDFNLQSAFYYFDYVLPIHIGMDKKSDIFIGSDIFGKNNAEVSMEKSIFYNERLTDIRVGELSSDIVSFTELSNRVLPPIPRNDNTLYLNFDGAISQSQPISPQFFSARTSTKSINESFGDALIIDKPTEIPNDDGIFSVKQGTVEFWIEPLEDILYGTEQHQYIFDTTSQASVLVTSTTSTLAVLPYRVKRINSIYLKGDKTKKNLAGPNSLKSDFKSVSLPNRLAKQKTELVIEYVPLNAYGDRVELFIDGYSTLFLRMTSDDKVATIARSVDWQRGSKHRVMFTYDIGNSNNLKSDKIQLFVDGAENSIVTWGTPGLIWGNGLIWGTSLAGSSGSQALITEIPIFEDFSTLVFGSDFNHDNKYKFKIDNLRFSSIAREGILIGNSYYDLSYNDPAVATPVIVDTWTKALFDFNKSEETSEFLSNLLSTGASQYSILVDIDDGFRKLIDNVRTKEALLNIYQMAKPAHMRLYANYKQSGTND